MSTVEIPLTHGLVALVDAADADLVLAYKWTARPDGRNVYAARKVRRPDGTRTTQFMHSLLTGYSRVDHVDGDGLNNRRGNLREATARQNGRNARNRVDNTSGFKGVTWEKQRRRWAARITAGDASRLTIGRYPTAEDAARAYDDAARELHGEYATVNFPQPGERAA